MWNNGGYCHCCHRGWVRRQHGQALPEKSADLQLLCRFYLLISNLRQPPHNNMADPACGSGATHSWRRVLPGYSCSEPGRRDEEIAHRPGGGVNPCGGGRWDKKGRRRAQRRTFHGRRKGRLAPPSGGFSRRRVSGAPCWWWRVRRQRERLGRGF